VKGKKRDRKRKVVKNILKMWGGGMFFCLFLLSNEVLRRESVVLCWVKKRGMEALEEVWWDEELKRV
jgi:hypothetical protein